MKYLKISFGVLVVLAASRFIPHPPNFTSLIALGFYVPAIFGVRYIPVVITSFIFTDLFFGLHNTVFYTWGSILIIGLISKYFNRSILFRLTGALASVLIFFLITNYGVWVNSGMYPNSLGGLIESYFLAIPFMGYNLLSTFIFSTLIETIFFVSKFKKTNLIK